MTTVNALEITEDAVASAIYSAQNKNNDDEINPIAFRNFLIKRKWIRDAYLHFEVNAFGFEGWLELTSIRDVAVYIAGFEFARHCYGDKLEY